jgi:transcription elongation GreA/GreB family factor
MSKFYHIEKIKELNKQKFKNQIEQTDMISSQNTAYSQALEQLKEQDEEIKVLKNKLRDAEVLKNVVYLHTCT